MNPLLCKGFGVFAIAFGGSALFTLAKADIILNATDSLRSNAFVVYDWPLVLRRGAVIAADMPPVLADDFGEHAYVKVIRGLPGDEIVVLDDGVTCVAGYCAPPLIKDGAAWAPAIAPMVIPEGKYAVFGTSENSLDSRYDVIGLIPEETIHAAGFSVPFPQWEVLAGWFAK